MSQIDRIREAAEEDLLTFIRLIAPHRVLGAIHEELISWWTRDEAKSHQLTLLPRGHQKSAMIAYRVAWAITRNPAITILYISATSNLAEKQLKSIQDILTSKKYRMYWPDMVEEQEGKREKWTTTEISVDHSLRKTEGVRDPTIFTAGLTTSITGMHCDLAVMDDIVVPENAYTQDGRDKVATQYSLLSSIENPDAEEWIVGTRYHPQDVYQSMLEMEEEIYDEDGEIISSTPVYEVFERQVEDMGDGTGEYIWPRQRREDGRWFGFNQQVLARKKAQYLDKTQFRAQYYNNPNDPDQAPVDSTRFQYYDKELLTEDNGIWFYNNKKLNVFAAIDFAFSRRKRADYTAIVVIGIDAERNIYVLDIVRFKTDRIPDYFEQLKKVYEKWKYKKLRAEVTVAQQAIVRELKETYFKQHGMSVKVDEYRPTRHEGSKEERVSAVLEPRYDNLSIYHYKGGLCQSLEEELVVANPPHDDIKDALASAIDVSAPPIKERKVQRENNVVYHSRFGGVAFR